MSNAIYALLEVNSKILRKSTKELYEKLTTWFFYKVIHPRIQPKQLPRIIIHFLRETIGSLTSIVLYCIAQLSLLPISASFAVLSLVLTALDRSAHRVAESSNCSFCPYPVLDLPLESKKRTYRHDHAYPDIL